MSKFSISIQEWYQQNHRDLPWRNTKNPYEIWLSEVILQQTRVDQGMNYYLKFTKHYPTVEELANASQEDVLNDWQGLGYYSRARNLHYAAQQIVSDFGGKFPNTFKEIKQLKGVGDYTASAIASFAYKLPHAVVDGNVYRVLSRYLDIQTPIDSTQGKKEFTTAASELLDETNPDTHNQAIMELGALVCTPKKPRCNSCPLNNTCYAYHNNKQQKLPVKSKKTKVQKRTHHYFIITDTQKKETIIRKRTGDGIWKNMYEFPAVESVTKISSEDTNNLLETLIEKKVTAEKISTVKHKLSHREIHATFYRINAKLKSALPEDHKRIDIKHLDNYPLPRLIDKFLEKNKPFFTH